MSAWYGIDPFGSARWLPNNGILTQGLSLYVVIFTRDQAAVLVPQLGKVPRTDSRRRSMIVVRPAPWGVLKDLEIKHGFNQSQQLLRDDAW